MASICSVVALISNQKHDIIIGVAMAQMKRGERNVRVLIYLEAEPLGVAAIVIIGVLIMIAPTTAIRKALLRFAKFVWKR